MIKYCRVCSVAVIGRGNCRSCEIRPDLFVLLVYQSYDFHTKYILFTKRHSSSTYLTGTVVTVYLDQGSFCLITVSREYQRCWKTAELENKLDPSTVIHGCRTIFTVNICCGARKFSIVDALVEMATPTMVAGITCTEATNTRCVDCCYGLGNTVAR